MIAWTSTKPYQTGKLSSKHAYGKTNKYANILAIVGTALLSPYVSFVEPSDVVE